MTKSTQNELQSMGMKREKLLPHAAESAIIIRIKQLLTQRTGFYKR